MIWLKLRYGQPLIQPYPYFSCLLPLDFIQVGTIQIETCLLRSKWGFFYLFIGSSSSTTLPRCSDLLFFQSGQSQSLWFSLSQLYVRALRRSIRPNCWYDYRNPFIHFIVTNLTANSFSRMVNLQNPLIFNMHQYFF